MSTSKLPEQVREVQAILDRDPADERCELAQKLMDETPEHISMWKSLERRKIGEDALWVWGFLETALMASTLPPYHYITALDRQDLSYRIKNLSRELSRTLKANGLDVHIIFNEGKIFNGFYVFEDFGESNRVRIKAAGKKKVQVSDLLKYVSERCCKVIEEEPLPGKAGKNAKAIRFIRIMAKRNSWLYKTPLNKVIATAANSIFETLYSASDIRKLLSR